MDDDVLLTTALTTLGLALIVYYVWARRGASPKARWWMGDGPVARPNGERMTILGAPAVALMCLSSAGIVAPVGGGALAAALFAVILLSFALVLIGRMSWISLPDALYPRWAREEHRRRKAAAQAPEGREGGAHGT